MSKPDPLTAEEENALRAFFEDARLQEAPPSDAFLARVFEDAASVAEAAEALPSLPSQPINVGLLGRLGQMLNNFGGLPGASVMTASVLFGLAFGYTGPDTLFELTGMADVAGIGSEFDAEMDVFDTTGFDFGEGDLLQ